MIKQYSTVEEIAEASQICLQYKLHEPFGSMRTWYIHNDIYINTLFIYFHYNKPIGAFAILEEDEADYYNCGICVRPEYRRRRFGKRLVDFAKSKGFEINPWTGSHLASMFYRDVLN